MRVHLSSLVFSASSVFSFQPPPAFRCRSKTFLLSSIGDDFQPPKPPDDDGDSGPVDDFLDGSKKENSQNMKTAREFVSDEALPISFDVKNENSDNQIDIEEGDLLLSDQEKSSGNSDIFEEPSEEVMLNNPYMKVVSNLTPSDLISKFTTSADPRVQDAVRSTILGLIGNLPKMAFDTTTITTGQRLASLMFQLQMTGYLFKNAEYRLSLTQSLDSTIAGTFALPESKNKKTADPLKGEVRGKLKIRYGKPNSQEKENYETSEDQPIEMEVDAAAYMSELRSEVSKLRNELVLRKKEKQEAIRKDLLLYIRTLPEQELRSLSSTISQDVLVAMKGLVNVVMAGIGEGQIDADTVTEQSGEAMAQLCMWQLVVGYNMRELEVREEMKKSLKSAVVSEPEEDPDISSGPGAFN
mmetsp:Transcript_27351/g.31223  ORF Transcript_27351/g.31223 Transcript_27351/m.31223 type:complete len:412 (+) Transcript_27351:107-1342(+)|eukprot:CAMPEP_0194146230 /NCGR_PEP_ID=MMETSP0152-20130528/20468_1 /TAXON_ID=1049557 /ORGANISM="Thalassiothrix antarctica, Strain L6-D1" /LENGTH=411 /DNA_ID=CAMNT_0038846709 /DNA_START=81 /DNA_END=1316 /DNA_ORIENTATION=-